MARNDTSVSGSDGDTGLSLIELRDLLSGFVKRFYKELPRNFWVFYVSEPGPGDTNFVYSLEYMPIFYEECAPSASVMVRFRHGSIEGEAEIDRRFREALDKLKKFVHYDGEE